MQGVKLSDLVRQLKVACNDDIRVNTALDAAMAVSLSTMQDTLAATTDWASLETRADVAIAGGARTAVLPSLNFSRPVLVERFYNEVWEPLEYGIGAEEYNIYNEGVIANPILRWRSIPFVGAGESATFEVWPTPSVAQTVRFTGQRALLPLLVGDDVCTVDSNVLVFFCAAERLAALKSPNAQTMLSKANALASSLKSVEHRKGNVFSLTAYDESDAPRKKFVPILTAP